MIGSTSLINFHPNPAGMQGASSASFPLPSSKAGSAADLLTLSPTANMLQQFLSMDIQETGSQGETDLTGLSQLKQRGDMLSGILTMKLKNFESSLISSMKSAGLDPSRSMDLKDGSDGLQLLNDLPDKSAVQNLLGSDDMLRAQFQDISRTADLLGLLQQLGTYHGGLNSSAAQYAMQSQQHRPVDKLPDAEFVLHVTQGQASYTFE